MANGPPTPPPTTAAELLDEARSIAPITTEISSAPSTSTSVPQPHPQSTLTSHAHQQSSPDVYQHVFPLLTNLAAQNDFHELIRAAETGDLNGNGDKLQTRLLVTAPLVLSYLIINELPPARYALTRLPDNLAVLPLSQALAKLLASTWERKHARVYECADALFNLAGQSDLPHPKLGSVLGGLVTTFIESFRHRTFVTVSKAYTSLPLSLAQTYFGLSADQLHAVTEKNYWSYDASTQILSPAPPSSNPVRVGGVLSGSSSLVTFHMVADSVAKLEA